MKFENLKIGKCPQCDKNFDDGLKVDDEGIAEHECGFKIENDFRLRLLEQGKREAEVMQAIEKLDINQDLLKMFANRFLRLNGGWRIKEVFAGQVVRNNKGGQDDFFLAIPFKGKPPMTPKGIKRPVNQGKRRGFTKIKVN